MTLHPALKRLLLVLCVAWVGLQVPADASASARESYLIRLLKGSSQFRVRVQAAISLGGAADDADVVDALSEALSDAHPAVRAAAAHSLGRIGNPSALPALKRAESDPEAPVKTAARAAVAKLSRAAPGRARPGRDEDRAPAGAARFYVAVGETASRVPGMDGAILKAARSHIRETLGRMDGVELAPGDESPRRVSAVLQKRGLKGFYIDSAITSVEPRAGGGTRVAVSVIVGTYPGRDMRAIMNGAATAIGSGSSVRQQALEGALSGALRKLPQAMQTAR